MRDFSFYFGLGWEHIMSIDALDHILFLIVLAALYTLHDWKAVLILVTAFTVGHSITLALSTLNWLTVPSSLVEFLIPCTIVITALYNVLQRQSSPKQRNVNYLMALFFGLIHGLGFANTLRFILASDQDLGWALFGFNVGLEAGQVLVVIIILIIAEIFTGLLRVQRREWSLFLSAAVFGLALQMALERIPGKAEAATATHSGHGVLKKMKNKFDDVEI